MLEFLTVALKNIFSKPATRNYPFEKRAPYKNQKGHISININDCIFCGLCGRKCPVNAIEVNRTEGTWQIDRFKCIMCLACTESCPKKCLSVEPIYTAPANEKKTDKFVGQPPAIKAVPNAGKGNIDMLKKKNA
ncbi:4Fe-4S dicluster domain-containing protein [[Clostridium] cellulosi]|jgi:hypothetical protein